MIKGGKGGANTLTGLEFEKRVNLRRVFNNIPNYTVKDNDLIYNGKIIGKMYKKHELYNKFLKELKVRYNKLVSQKLLPDESIFITKKKTIFIIEMKFQHGSGSVDEKLQTCDFKKKQYQKLFSKTGIKVEYIYILNDWFKKERYKDVLNYIKSVGCKYFFENLPFKVIGLPEPKFVKVHKRRLNKLKGMEVKIIKSS